MLRPQSARTLKTELALKGYDYWEDLVIKGNKKTIRLTYLIQQKQYLGHSQKISQVRNNSNYISIEKSK